MKKQLLVSAAIAGIMSVGAGANAAKDAKTDAKAEVKGHCMKDNSCKGQSGCQTATNACKGQNACDGKGFVEKTEKECNADAAKNPTKGIKFVATTAAKKK